MVKKYRFFLFTVLLSLFLATGIYAFDGQRKGFLLGMGIGPGSISFSEKRILPDQYYGERDDSKKYNKMGIASDFKIGYASNNHWGIYYTSKVLWFKMKCSLIEEVGVASGLGAATLCYWFKPQAPSPFVSGGLGYSAWSLPFEENAPETWMGPGFFMGGGFEFSRHWSFEANFLWGAPKKDLESIDILSFMITMNVLGY